MGSGVLSEFYCPLLFTVTFNCPVDPLIVAVMVTGPPTVTNDADPLDEFMLTMPLLLELQPTPV